MMRYTLKFLAPRSIIATYCTEQVRLCKGRKDMKCWKYEVNLPFDECLKPCQGLYVDVKKDAVKIEQETQYEQMMTEYANYTWFQEDNTAPLEGELPKMII